MYLSLLIWIIAIAAVVYWGQTFDRNNYNLLGKRKLFLGLSALLLIISAATLATQGLKKGLDFTGGTILEVGSYKQVTPNEVKDAFKDFPDIGGLTVQVGTDMIKDPNPEEGQAGEYQKVLVRLTLADGSPLDPTKTQAALTQLKTKLGDVKELRTASIGPTISGELTNNAIKALVLALVAQLIYIFLRFGNQVRYGIAADLALLHDVVIMMGFYSLSGREVDSPFVAALLTIVGYSVMDSVVIFDRIRENLNDWWAEHGEDKVVPYDEIVNDSLCQTMTRSINTTLTTIVTLVAIYFFGGETLQSFAFALIVGIIGGAYSSVAIASPLLCAINEKYPATPPHASNWYDTDEVVPEDYMSDGDDDEVYQEDTGLPRSGGRRRSRGKRS